MPTPSGTFGVEPKRVAAASVGRQDVTRSQALSYRALGVVGNTAIAAWFFPGMARCLYRVEPPHPVSGTVRFVRPERLAGYFRPLAVFSFWEFSDGTPDCLLQHAGPTKP